MLSSINKLRSSLWRARALGKQVLTSSYASQAQTHKFSLPDNSFELHKLKSGPSLEVELTRDESLAYYKEMVDVREMELAARELYRNKDIRGFLHDFVGQEACCTGMEAAISKEDCLITAYRCHAWTYTRGATFKEILAELTGKSTGVSKGKGGSMHMYGENFYGGNGIVGAQVPLGAGIAFALKYNESDRISVTLYGDGAANQGQVFESFNMAALWNLPCLFVCENNQYGMGTAMHRASASTDFYKRGDYIPGIKVNGQDILAVREATKFCADYIRAGNGPLVMELDTYRYYGHSISDPGKSYRDGDEVRAVRKERDPIKLMSAYALEGNLITEQELKDMRTETLAKVEEAVKFALEGTELPVPELYTDIHINQGNLKVRGCDPFTWNNTA